MKGFVNLMLLFFAFVLCPSQSLFAAAPKWESIPLQSQAQYDAGINGGEGFQEVHAIAYAPSNPNRVYMGTNTSGMWRSNGGGSSWEPIMSNFPAFGVRSIAVDPLDANIVFAAGHLGETCQAAAKFPEREQGIYRSTDGGITWTKVMEGAFCRQLTTGGVLVVSPAPGDQKRSSHIYVATYDKLYFSNQAGEPGTWRGPVAFPGAKATETTKANYPELLSIVLAPGTKGAGAKILVSTPEALYSYQSGIVKKIGQGLPPSLRSVATTPASPNLVLAAAGTNGLFISYNSGESFKALTAPLGIPFSDVAISPVNANIQYARGHESGRKPLCSHDGGQTWRSADNTNQGNLVPHQGWWYSSPFAPHPTDPLVALHSSNGRPGMLRTSDGGKNWQYSGSGFTGGRMRDMIFLETGEVYMCLVDHGLWLLHDNGVTRKMPLESPLGNNTVEACSGDADQLTLTIGTWHNRAIATGTRTDPDNIQWRYNTDHPGSYTYSFTQKKPYLRVVGDQIQFKQNGPWQTLQYQVFFVAKGSKPVLYALKTSALNKNPSSIIISYDYGKSWSDSIAPLPATMKTIRHIAVTTAPPEKTGKIFVGTQDGLWMYQGGKWSLASDASGMKPDRYGRTYVMYIAIDPKNDETVYVARHGRGYGRTTGIFRSTDGGKTWQDFSGNYPTEAVHSVHINPYNDDVYIGSSIGTYRLVSD